MAENKSKKLRVAPYEKLSINISIKHMEMFRKEADARKWSYRIMMEHILGKRYFGHEE